MKSNFDCLTMEYPQLESLGEKAEKEYLSSPADCIITIGTMAEKITEEISGQINLDPEEKYSQFERIQLLELKEEIPESIAALLHEIRIAKNRLANGIGSATERDALRMLRNAYYLAEWFMKDYNSVEYKSVAFYVPAPEEYAKNRHIEPADSTKRRLWHEVDDNWMKNYTKTIHRNAEKAGFSVKKENNFVAISKKQTESDLFGGVAEKKQNNSAVSVETAEQSSLSMAQISDGMALNFPDLKGNSNVFVSVILTTLILNTYLLFSYFN